jgi:Family of unknown function (DUF5695)
MANSLAYAQTQWQNVEPCNVATSRMLAPNETITVGLRLSPSAARVRGVEDVVKAVGKPYAIGVPGYIFSADKKATLHFQYNANVSNITLDPAGALSVSSSNSTGACALAPANSAWGRARVSIHYSDGALQTVHYYITKSGPSVLDDYGNFTTTAQWYDDTSDPFLRAPSVMSYDRQANQIIVQEARVYIAGLSDEAGSGSYTGSCMKQYVQPHRAEIAKLEDFIDQTLFNNSQLASGSSEYTVRMCLFFHDPAAMPDYPYDPSFDWDGSWDKNTCYATIRAYDYVHVTAAYWAIYRVARAYPDIVTHHTWDWYLTQAY